MLSSVYLIYLSCDILPKNNIYTVKYREIGTFLPLLTPGFAPIFPQIKVNFSDRSKVVICVSCLHVM